MGPNNSGKSALLSVIDFYRASFWNYPGFRPTYGSEIHTWGDPSSFSHQQDDIGSIELEVEFGEEGTTGVGLSYMNGQWRVALIDEKGVGQPRIRYMLHNIWHLLPVRHELPPSRPLQRGKFEFQPTRPNGQDVIQFLMEQWTSRNPLWAEAEKWLKRIDPHMDLLSTPLRGDQASIETWRSYDKEHKDTATVNIAYQGTGMQSACSVVAALVFSKPNTTIIIEEPEAYLHPRSQEVIVDLMNDVVNRWNKQVVVSTHSWDIILPFISDIGTGQKRGADHVKADPKAFSLVMIDDKHSIDKYDLKGKTFMDVRDRAKELWG